MLTARDRDRLCVVLVGARNPQNIGAAARAMQDFGFSHLRVVNSFAPPFDAAQLEAKSAVGAGEIMRTARLFSDLPAAIADCGLVVGTTAIGDRGLEQSVLTLQEAAPVLRAGLHSLAASDRDRIRDTSSAPATEMSEISPPSLVALVFGSEKTGLTREQLSFCTALLTIPLWEPQGRHLSMNLGQAVAVCLYELGREGFQGSRELPQDTSAPASAADRERLLSLLLEAMQVSDYARRFPANARPEIVRRLVQSLARSPSEAATWMGFLKLVLRRMLGPTLPEI